MRCPLLTFCYFNAPECSLPVRYRHGDVVWANLPIVKVYSWQCAWTGIAYLFQFYDANSSFFIYAYKIFMVTFTYIFSPNFAIFGKCNVTSRKRSKKDLKNHITISAYVAYLYTDISKSNNMIKLHSCWIISQSLNFHKYTSAVIDNRKNNIRVSSSTSRGRSTWNCSREAQTKERAREIHSGTLRGEAVRAETRSAERETVDRIRRGVLLLRILLRVRSSFRR